MLNFHLFSLIRLIISEAFSKRDVKILDFMVFAIIVFDWSSIKSSDELHSSDCALSSPRSSQFFREDWIA